MFHRLIPAIEALECRLAPSLTPMFETPVGAVVQPPLPPAIHATITSPTPSAATVVSVAVSPSDTAPAAPMQLSMPLWMTPPKHPTKLTLRRPAHSYGRWRAPARPSCIPAA